MDIFLPSLLKLSMILLYERENHLLKNFQYYYYVFIKISYSLHIKPFHVHFPNIAWHFYKCQCYFVKCFYQLQRFCPEVTGNLTNNDGLKNSYTFQLYYLHFLADCPPCLPSHCHRGFLSFWHPDRKEGWAFPRHFPLFFYGGRSFL